MTERSTGGERHTPGLTEAQLASLLRFVYEETPHSPRDIAAIDQGASTLKNQLGAFGLKIETPEQFYVAVIATVVATENTASLIEGGISSGETRAYVRQTIAALSPLHNYCAPVDIEPTEPTDAA